MKFHGMSRSAEYQIWNHMRLRCTDPGTHNFADYGGRGIKVCARWMTEFEAFYSDMGPRPGPGYSLDRIDNAGDYEPGNCRWATSKQQARNRRNNHLLTWANETLTISEWSEMTGIPKATLRMRIVKYRWSVEAALTTPVAPRKPRLKK